ncbi:MAG: hypothetical protein EBS82_05495 [Methylocystaceae bacterium]|nr:hypothetical protein [Methylocystaceae bacterium]
MIKIIDQETGEGPFALIQTLTSAQHAIYVAHLLDTSQYAYNVAHYREVDDYIYKKRRESVPLNRFNLASKGGAKVYRSC